MRLQHAMLVSDSETARREVRTLIEMTEGKEGPYVSYLHVIERDLKPALIEHVIRPSLPAQFADDKFNIYVNPTGRFETLAADTVVLAAHAHNGEPGRRMHYFDCPGQRPVACGRRAEVRGHHRVIAQ